MTTRKEKLLRELGCDNFDSHPRLKTPGEGIVRKCDGLPLALIALGRLLRTNEDEVKWKEIEDSEIWSLKEGGLGFDMDGRRIFAPRVGVKEWWQDNYLSSKVLVDLLPELRFLMVLSLSGYEISEVPSPS
nr:NB-ARC domains-containing protein [Tanacetum cinerariifolium]